MVAKRVITNAATDVQLLNMDPASSVRGPYLITQIGSAPSDETCTERFWILRRDGLWADINHYLSTGQLDTMNEALYDNTKEAIAALSKLSGKARVVDLPVDPDGLRAAFGPDPKPNPGLPGVRAWMARYKAQRDG